MPTAREFKRWVTSNKVGHVYVYYTGYLAYDRGSLLFPKVGAPIYEVNSEIDDLANEAMRAYDRGKVMLFQRKLGDRCYEYLAIRRYTGQR